VAWPGADFDPRPSNSFPIDLLDSGTAIPEVCRLRAMASAALVFRAAIKLILGAEVPLEDAATAVLLAMDRAGDGHLRRLLTLGRRRAEKPPP
jgi:hypothetical protein